jgi:hypothetical protein
VHQPTSSALAYPVSNTAVKRHNLVVAEHSLQRQIADALRIELAPPGKVSHDGVV